MATFGLVARTEMCDSRQFLATVSSSLSSALAIAYSHSVCFPSRSPLVFVKCSALIVTLSPAVTACGARGDDGDGGLSIRRQATLSWPQRLELCWRDGRSAEDGEWERGSN